MGKTKKTIGLIAAAILFAFGIAGTLIGLLDKFCGDWFDNNAVSSGFKNIVSGIVEMAHGLGWLFIGSFSLLCLAGFLSWRFLKKDKTDSIPQDQVLLPELPSEPVKIKSFKKLKLGHIDERVGRDKDLEWLDKKLIYGQTVSVAVVSVHGGGGMGKTFLAHVFADMHKGETAGPDEQEIEFRELFVGDRPALDAGIEFLGRYGVDTSKIRKQDHLKIVFREHIFSTGHGVLIIDDVWRKDAEILIPKELINWRVLITTRDRELANNFTEVVRELDKFTPDEAIELFKKVLEDAFDPALESDYKKLAESLGRRPYGLRLAAKSMKAGKKGVSQPGQLLEQLKKRGLDAITEKDSEDKTLALMLEHCLSQLKENSEFAKELLNSLAACTDSGMELGHFLSWQCKDDITEDQVENELALAQALDLIFYEQKIEKGGLENRQNNLRMHTDLHKVLNSSDLAEQFQSLHEFLLATLIQSSGAMEPKRSLQKQVTALFIKFKNNPEIIRGLYDDFDEHLYRTGNLKLAHELGENHRQFLDEKKDASTLSKVLGNQALILMDWGQLDEAMELFKKQEEICKQLGDKAGLSACYGNQALIFQAWGKLDKAMELHKKVEKICIKFGDKAGLSACYVNQALILRAWGKLDKAMKLYKKAEKICKELGNKAGLSACYGNQAVIFQMQGQLDKAMELFKKVEEICEQLGDRAGLSICYGNQALIFQNWGQLDKAMELHKKQEKICEQLGDRAGLINCYWNTGLLLREMGQDKEAIEKFKQAIILEKELKHPDLKKDEKYLAKYEQEIEKNQGADS